MDHRLDDLHPLYLQMTVTGRVDKTGIIRALSELLNHPDYPSRHTLWDFSRASMGLSLEDLWEIAGVLKLYKPRAGSFKKRSALLVPSLMELGMVKIYISISRMLPFEYKAFSNRQEALDFLSS